MRPSSHFLVRLVFLVGLLAARSLMAGNYIDESAVDPLDLLPEPAAAGSDEMKAELELVVRVHAEATPAAIEEAKADNELTPFAFKPAIGPWFESGRFPKLEALLKRAESDARAITSVGKMHWQRSRPCLEAPDRIKDPVEPDDVKNFGYPSGHATRATLYALILAEVFPGAREEILAEGQKTGFLRVVGGMHYPSDIYAGRVLGMGIFRALMKQPEFQKELDAVAEEVATYLREKAA